MTNKELLTNMGYSCCWVSSKGWSKMVKFGEDTIWVSRYGAMRKGNSLKNSISITPTPTNTAHREWMGVMLEKRSQINKENKS